MADPGLPNAENAATDDLLALLNDAVAASDEKSRFLASLSHELRTPLTTILGFCELLLDEPESLNDEQADSIGEIRNAGSHMLSLINEVLDLAKIDAGKTQLVLRPVAVGPLLSDVATLVKPQATNAGMHLMVDDADDVFVTADHRALKQVLLNLCSNAIKHSGRPSEVRVQAAVDGDRVRIIVSDDGLGIDPDHQEGIFDPFRRTALRHSEHEGSGIGLPLSRRLMEKMAGTLTLQSTPGKGTCFAATLPRAE